MVVADGQLAPVPLPAAEMKWDFLPPFARQKVIELPSSEIVLITQHLRTSELHTYLSHNALLDVRDPRTRPPEPADDKGQSARFLVDVIVRRGDHTQRITAQGRDIYAFSAPLVCEAVERILGGKASGNDAQAPGAIFDAKDFLSVLVQQHTPFAVAAE